MQEPGPPSPARADCAAPQAPLRKESSSSSVSRTDELRNSGRGNISRKSSSNDVLSVSQRNEAELSKLSNEELRRATIMTADKLYKLRQHQQVLDALLAGYQRLPQDTEILWRMCRAYFDLSELQPKETRKEYLEVGFQFAEKGLDIDDKLAVFHKWWAIFCSLLGDFQPPKEKIGNAFKIKEHAMKANELTPNDATTLHLLGRWCFSVANITWIERTAASALFSSPPSSSYEEALGYFLKASTADEKFTRNMILVGDCYVALKKYADAKAWYRKAADMPFDEKIKCDVVYHDEAETKYAKYKGY